MNEKLLQANGRRIRLGGITYRIISTTLGNRTLADADPINGDCFKINLMHSRTNLSKQLRNLVNLGLFV